MMFVNCCAAVTVIVGVLMWAVPIHETSTKYSPLFYNTVATIFAASLFVTAGRALGWW